MAELSPRQATSARWPESRPQRCSQFGGRSRIWHAGSGRSGAFVTFGVACFLLSLVLGCTTVPTETVRETAREPVSSDPAWAEARREEGGESALTGLSERSRQIERNLGLR